MTRDLAALFPDTIILASAGTGKTWQLTTRYLRLLRCEQPLDQILASTFARKAAGEILARILSRLAEAASDEGRRGELEAALDLGPLSRDQAAAMLERVLSQVHRLRVGTLDSFFVQTAGSFALELELPGRWSILEDIDDRALRLEALRELLQRETNSFDALLTLLGLLQGGESARGVIDHLLATVQDFYAVFVDSDPTIWNVWPVLPTLSDGELAEAMSCLRDTPLPDDARFTKAHEKLVAAAAEAVDSKNWENVLGNGLVKAVMSDSLSYYNKVLSGDLANAIRPLLQHARGVFLNAINYQTEATGKLLRHFHEHYHALKLSRGKLRFDDVTRLLSRHLNEELLPQVGYRIDAALSHFLLDEFQDTSLAQWNVLKPFVARANRTPGQSLFCVGDVKQAIYGWRGGESEILERIPVDLNDVQMTTLAQSRRSSPVVIETVNAIFGDLTGNPALQLDEKTFLEPDFLAGVKANWRNRFQPHSTVRSELAGFARVQTYPEAEEPAGNKSLRFEIVAEAVAELHRTHSGCTIGVLTRTNATVRQLIHRLRNPRSDREPVFASEEGGNPLTDAAGTIYLLSLLKLAAHPGNQVAQFNVAHSPLAQFVGLDGYRPRDPRVVELAGRIRAELLRDGYGKTLERWVRVCAPSCNERELARLGQLVELAWRYEPRATLDPADFVRFVEETRVESPSSADVRVMTIHQSKGLEFDIVVLPELDALILGGRESYLVQRDRPTEPVSRILRSVSRDYLPLLPDDMRDLYRAHGNRLVNESLCLLYVALTRAVHALHVFVPAAKKSNPTPLTMAGIVLSAVGSAPLDPGVEQFRAGDEHWYEAERARHGGILQPAPATEEPLPQPIKLAPVDPRRIRNLNVVTPSSHGGAAGFAGLAEFDRSLARAQGSLVHAWFEQIGWLDEGPPGDERLLSVAGRYRKPGLDVDAMLVSFRDALAHDGLRWNLTADEYRERVAPQLFPPLAGELASGTIELRVERERRLTYRTDRELVNGIADRLILYCRGDVIVAVDIIDYKTDRGADADELKARYREQLRQYSGAIRTVFKLPADRVATRLALIALGEVVRV